MEKDWKSNIGEYFGKNNVYRLEYLNSNLYSYCTEYINYLKEFENIRATVMREPYKGGHYASFEGIKYGLLVTVGMGPISPVFFDYKMSCFFNVDSHLIIESAVDCNLFMNKTNRESYEYQEEEFSETEKVEKEYIFELFNLRLIRYIETLKKMV